MENLNTRYSTTTTAFLSAVRRHDFHTPQSEILTVFFLRLAILVQGLKNNNNTIFRPKYGPGSVI